MDSFLGWIILLGLGLFALWAIVMVLGSIIAGWGKGSKKPKEPKPAKKVEKPADDHGHGHDDKKDKKGNALSFALKVLAFVIGACALLWFVLWLIEADKRNRNQMMPERYYGAASAVTYQAPPPPPPDAVECKGLRIPAATIQPGAEIVVATRRGTVFSARPDTSEGTITECNYYNRSQCTSAEVALSIDTSAFVVRNISSNPVPYFCVHRPMG